MQTMMKSNRMKRIEAVNRNDDSFPFQYCQFPCDCAYLSKTTGKQPEGCSRATTTLLFHFINLKGFRMLDRWIFFLRWQSITFFVGVGESFMNR